jgi:hypothetical protein
VRVAVLVGIQFGLSIRDLFGLVLDFFGSVQGCFDDSRLLQFGLVWFGSRFLRFGSRLLQFSSVWFKVISVVQGCFSGSRLLRQCKVMSVVQGGFASVRFKVICFG